jgi:DNA-binding FadR family transcriptional regulator
MLRADIIRRPKLYEEVVKRIELAIQNGEYAPGDQLPSERELTETFGVGRSAVREAFFALQKMGLVTINNGERARVTIPTPALIIGELSSAARRFLAIPENIRHFQQARALFEVGLVRYAAEHATSDQLEALAEALEANRKAIGDASLWERTDVGFHYVLATMPGNPIFTALHAAILGWLIEQRTTSMQARGSVHAAYRAHARIYETIAAKDVSGAERAMRNHLAAVAKYYWQVRK